MTNRILPHTLRIVLLDDDESELTTIGLLLADAGISIEPTVTLEEVHSLASDITDHLLVLLSLHAEPDAGIRVMRELDSDPTLRAQCTVVDIARALGHTSAHAVRQADRVVEAPLSPRQLIGLIREYVQGSGSDVDMGL